MRSLSFSVREFARPNARHGHIDMFSGYRGEISDGAEIHRTIQDKDALLRPGYQKEFYLKQSFVVDDCEITLTGRIDALIVMNDVTTIEEIKSTSNIDRLCRILREDPEHPYILQVQTYAYLYYLQNNVVPECQLKLVSTLSRKEEIVEIIFELTSFLRWRDHRVKALLAYTQVMAQRVDYRRACAEQMTFPFSQMRPQQEDLISTVADAVENKAILLAQAPTGLGKTAGVSFPALQEAFRRGKQLVYVTPKNSQHRLAEDVVERLRAQGLRLRSLLLTAKAKICMQDEMVCTPEHCEYARNYYDKLSEHKIVESLADCATVDAELLRSYAEKYTVCPFELGLEVVPQADVVVGDYNYVFSPRAALMSLQINAEDETSLQNNLVIDEVHNLPQRLCDYLSPEVSELSIRKLRENAVVVPESLQEKFNHLLDETLRALAIHRPLNARGMGRHLVNIDWEVVHEIERRIDSFMMTYFDKVEKVVPQDPVLMLQRLWGELCHVASYPDIPYFTTFRIDENGATSLKVTCCDGASIAREALNNFNSIVGFSATTKPFEYFSKMCGFTQDRLRVAEFSTPFAADNRKLMIIPQISTRFRDRERSLQRIAETVRRIVSLRKGNYFIFFPSYEYLQRAAAHIHVDGYRILKQDPFMSQQDAQLIIDSLNEQSRGVLVLAVQGGVFSEGVDYPGDVLIGAFIIGPGLPGFDFEREQLRLYYEDRFGAGFEYAYVYPGMIRVIQAAGRVIRTETDRGLIILIDDRFTDLQYATSMPGDWYREDPKELVSSQILQDIADFWQCSGS